MEAGCPHAAGPVASDNRQAMTTQETDALKIPLNTTDHFRSPLHWNPRLPKREYASNSTKRGCQEACRVWDIGFRFMAISAPDH